MNPGIRIAVAHEWLTNWAGSERVAEQMVRTTDADQVVASVVDPDLASARFPGRSVRPLWPSRLPGARTRWTLYALPMMAAWATSRVRADALLVSSHFAAHGACLRFDGPSIVYYHTPARVLWRPDMELDRLPERARAVTRHLALPPLRRFDRAVGRRPTLALANSHAVARRVEDAYGRPATVLHPPVDVKRWMSVERRAPSHLLYFGRLVAYKRPDIAVEAARMSGLPLLVIGDGPERERLERDAPAHVRFLGHAAEPTVRDALAHAAALVFPGEEDFGIAPVEALAAGVPVIAYDAGGVRDFVVHDENGVLVPSQDPRAFADAVESCWHRRWDVEKIRESALPFEPEAFRRGLGRALDSVLGSRWRPGP